PIEMMTIRLLTSRVQRNADETLVREILASGHYLDSASHRLFTDAVKLAAR
ncbi:hypothetical protein HAX54_000137, partial [Datura stramonium]|nr:hypothetical protein [Datura stramonium]